MFFIKYLKVFFFFAAVLVLLISHLIFDGLYLFKTKFQIFFQGHLFTNRFQSFASFINAFSKIFYFFP